MTCCPVPGTRGHCWSPVPGLAAASAARDHALTSKASTLRDRLCAEAGKLAVDGPVQHAHQLTFTAEAGRAARVLSRRRAGEVPQPGDVPSAWDEAAQAWEAVGQRYPLAVALLRSAEAALSAGDRDGGTARLRRAAWPSGLAPGR